MDFAVPADHRVKIKENKKINKYLDLARELKNEGDDDNTVLGSVSKKLGKKT